VRFDLKRPCVNCPFRRDVPGFLSTGRAEEITDAILRQDQTFTCHKTLSGERTEDEHGMEGDYHAGPKDQFCAGALIFLEKNGFPSYPPRLAMALKLWSPDQMRSKELVFDTAAEMLEHHNA